ncbi:MAG: glycoside hydrolase family 3 protein [Treponema sp.]|jgi:beta-N-acetylhexosaminidase|nr:glycoside hydrolase family 3 protein [Treponema sp.]
MNFPPPRALGRYAALLFFVAGLLGTAGLSGQDRAARIASSLDNASLAAQVIMSGVDGKSRLDPVMGRILRECPPGAVMLFRYNLNSPPEEARRFIAQCVEAVEAGTRPTSGMGGMGKAPPGGPIPPLIAVDHEGGQVHRFGPGISRLPPAASWEDRARQEGKEAALEALEALAYASGREIRNLGVNLNLAPVAETLNDENRLFLEDRGFSSEPGFTAAAAAAFIRGMERAGVGCVAKHFPGNSGADPHRSATVLSGNREELARAVEPFASLIRGESPLAGLMVSHVLVPAWDPRRIGTFSPVLINQWVRGNLGFQGLILVDDFSMAASGTEPGEAAVLSLAAGADMVMAWPSSLRQVRGAILAALEGGRLTRPRLEEATARIIREKIRMGLL